MPSKKKPSRDEVVAHMLGGAADRAKKRGGMAPQRRAAAAPASPGGSGRAVYYEGDSSSGLVLVQAQVVVSAQALAPHELGGATAELKKLLRRGRDDAPDVKALATVAAQSPPLEAAAARGLRGLHSGSWGGASAAACERMRSIGEALRAEFVKRGFLPPGIAAGMDTLAMLEAVAGGTEACVAGAQLVLDGLYPEACRAQAKLTTVDYDADTSPHLVLAGAAAPAVMHGVVADVASGAADGADAALDNALAEGLLSQLSAASPQQLAGLDDLLHALDAASGACTPAAKTLAEMVASARIKRALAAAEGPALAESLREAFADTIAEMSAESGRGVGEPRIRVLVGEADALCSVANALELDLPSEDGQPARLGRGERLVLELWRDEAGAEEEAWLVTVSSNGQRVRSSRHFGELMPLGKLLPAPAEPEAADVAEQTRKERLEKLGGAEPEPEPEPGR